MSTPPPLRKKFRKEDKGNINFKSRDDWIPDKKMATCFNCDIRFTFFNRKHHCRVCGNIFCDNCCRKRTIEQSLIRSCEFCYEKISKYKKSTKYTAVDSYQEAMEGGDIQMYNQAGKFPSGPLDSPSHGGSSPHMYDPDLPPSKNELEFGGEVRQTFEKSMNVTPIDYEKMIETIRLEKVIPMNTDGANRISNQLDSLEEEKLRIIAAEVLKIHALPENFVDLLVSFALKAVHSVKPSSHYLGDSMNYLSYIKLKKILAKDERKSRYIHGVVCTKNVADKRMKTRVENPRLLLLNCALEEEREMESYSHLNKFIIQETHFNKRVIKNILLGKPNLVLVGKNVSRPIVDALRTNGITLFSQVKSGLMSRIARCSQTIILPSTDLIPHEHILGKCQKFNIEQNLIHSDKFDNGIANYDNSYAVFEGCNPILGCTICLCGPKLAQLTKLKEAFRIILGVARDINLEKSYLQHALVVLAKGKEEVKVMEEFKNEGKGNNSNSISNTSHKLFLMDTLGIKKYLDLKNIVFTKVYTSSLEENIEETTTERTESFILEHVKKNCGPPEMYSIDFYGSKDLTLGQFIFNLTNNLYSLCSFCKKPRHHHTLHYYHDKGKVKITTLVTHNFLLKTNEIFMKSYCNECEDSICEEFKMKEDCFEYSFGRILMQYFYNGELQTGGHNCPNKNTRHYTHRNLTRIFKCNEAVIKFEFEPVQHYSYNEVSKTVDLESHYASMQETLKSQLAENYQIFCKYISHSFALLKQNIEVVLHHSNQPPIHNLNTLKNLLGILERIYGKQQNEYLESEREMNNYKFQNYLEVEFMRRKIYLHSLKFQQYFIAIKSMFSTQMEEIRSQLLSKHATHHHGAPNRLTLPKPLVNFSDSPKLSDNEYTPSEPISPYPASKETGGKEFKKEIKEGIIISSKEKEKDLINHVRDNMEDNIFDENLNSVGEKSKSKVIDGKDRVSLRGWNIEGAQAEVETFHSICTSLNHMKTGNIALEPGIQDLIIPIFENDYGSIIAYALTSKQYRESLVKLNFLDLQNRIRTVSKIPNAGQEHNSNFVGEGRNKLKTEAVTDFFNMGCKPEEIESELLSTHRIYLQLKISTYPTFGKPQMSIMNLGNQMKEILPQGQTAEKNSLNSQILKKIDLDLLSNQSFTNTLVEIYSMDCQENTEQKFIDTKDKHKLGRGSTTVHPLHPNSEAFNSGGEEKGMKNITMSSQSLPVIGGKQVSQKAVKLMRSQNNIIQGELFERKMTIEITMYYAKQFEALRRHLCKEGARQFLLSIATSNIWRDNTGGKQKGKFIKSHDEKYVMKCIPKSEMRMFNNTATQYFHYICKCFFHSCPSVLAKILGAYKIYIKNSSANGGRTEKYYVLLMENIFFGMDKSQIVTYDLKGSIKNRFIKHNRDSIEHFPQVTNLSSPFQLGGLRASQKKQIKVLHDTNFLEDMNGEGLSLTMEAKQILEASIHNDSYHLSKLNVVDYSLLTVIDTKKGTINLGIIDYIRQYTLDKILEHASKKMMYGRNPTIINPQMYKNRFRNALNNYFIGIPSLKEEERKENGANGGNVDKISEVDNISTFTSAVLHDPKISPRNTQLNNSEILQLYRKTSHK